MIFYNRVTESGTITQTNVMPESLENLVWGDMLSPTREDELLIENFLNIDIPTRDEMHEIEVSSRLYLLKGDLYITTILLTDPESEIPESHSVTFVIRDKILITIRYSEPSAFKIFHSRINKGFVSIKKYGFEAFLEIMEIIIDKHSDILGIIGHELDHTSQIVFQNTYEAKKKTNKKRPSNYLQVALKKIGRCGDLNGKINESLLSLSRAFIFIQNSAGKYSKGHSDVIKTSSQDIISLTEHSSYISSRVNLLLDATLGMINIQQNSIIKIFSVAAVVFLPP
jgi:magnesium transporter